MAANTSPIFVKNSYVKRARATAANTARDGSGTVSDIATGTTEGTRIERVNFAFEVTTTAGVIRFFHHDTTDYRLIKEITVAANTVSASNPAVSGEWSRSDGQPIISLPSGHKLAFSIEKAEACVAHALCGDY